MVTGRGDARGDAVTRASGARGERTQRIDLVPAVGVTLVAALVYLLALFTRVHPPEGFSVVLVTSAPLAAAAALAVLWSCGRVFNDPLLRWYAVGLAVGVVAMLLQLASFPRVSSSGGILGTGPDSNAALYLLFHLAGPAGALAGLTRVHRRWALPATTLGALVAVALSLDLVPLPVLLEPDRSFSTTLLVAEAVLLGLTVVVALAWARAIGRQPSAVHAWIGVSLLLAAADLLFNFLGGARFTPVWWASLSMRSATYLVLAGGCLAWLLLSLGSSERWTAQELSRREGQLGVAFGLTRRLLGVSESLSQAVGLEDVSRAVVDLARDGTEMAAAVLHVPRPDAVAAPPPSPALAGMIAAHETGSGAVLAQNRADLLRLLPGAPIPDTVASGALVPIGLGPGAGTAYLALWSHQDHRWSLEDAQFLSGLADQASQALQRALTYEAMATAATTLQESLLPARLPTPEDLVLLSAYRPLTAETQVGGDWFDCITIDERRVALVIGDVMGKGLKAAAVMGQVRVATRTAIAFDPSPTAVLRALDENVLELEEHEIVTMVYAVLDLQSGLLGIARAGHPPVLVARPGEGVEVVTDGGSPPIGVPVQERAEVWTHLERGSALVLYTDGLVESREDSIDVGIERTAAEVEAVHGTVATSADDRGAAWRAWLTEVQGRRAWQDDVAVLIALYG